MYTHTYKYKHVHTHFLNDCQYKQYTRIMSRTTLFGTAAHERRDTQEV